jgi:hypothetical protein
VKRSKLFFLVLGAGALLSANASAEGLDASQTLMCDLAGAAQCDGAAKCQPVTFEQIDLPPVIQVDFAEKQILTEDGQRRSPIASVETHDAVLLLQGHQDGRGWTLVIERATGALSAAVADAEGGFVVTGACIAH